MRNDVKRELFGRSIEFLTEYNATAHTLPAARQVHEHRPTFTRREIFQGNLKAAVGKKVFLDLSRQRRKDAEASGEELPLWQQLPWAWLVTSGAALAVLTLILTTYSGWNGDVTGTYTPPRMEDGKIVPGHFGEN